MTLLHVRLRGPTTTVTLPPAMLNANFTLKSYRVLFNRSDHGYYLAALTSSLFDQGNVVNYVKAGEPGTRFVEIPLILDPENKMTFEPQMEWNLGKVRGTSNVSFNITFSNCIERSRFDQAIFDSTDPAIRKLYGSSQYQASFGTKIPMYISPISNQPDNRLMGRQLVTAFPDTTNYPDTALIGGAAKPFRYTDPNAFSSNTTYGEDGSNNTPSPAPTTYPYPSSTVWVHTGVQVGSVDPQPGGLDYDTAPQSVVEANAYAKSGGALVGSGNRRGAIIYAYSVDLVFEVTI